MHFLKFLIPFLLGGMILLIDPPSVMDPRGWRMFAIFISTIVAIVLKPFPMGTVTLMALCIAVITNTITIQEGLVGFGSSMIWLIVFVFFIARGLIKTNLGARIAYLFMSLLGRSTIGLGYGIILTEFLIAPLIPSNTARAGGIMYPIIRSISQALGSTPEQKTERKIGSFLIQVCFHGNIITSAMFLTAMAGNPLAQSIAGKKNIIITWTNWFTAAIVPGIISLIVIPLVIYLFYPPKIRKFPEAVELAKQKLRDLGPISKNEWLMIIVFAFMLFFWVFSESLNIHSCTTALMGVCFLLVFKILDWKDIIHEKEAFDVFVWLSILVTLSSFLEKYGFIAWFSSKIGTLVTGMPWLSAFVFLVLIYFYSHYFFSSNSSHVSAMYGAFLSVAIAAGTPPLLAALMLGFSSSLFSSMTHYGTSPGVILYGTRYVSTVDWWKVGFIVSIVNICIWLGLGPYWWKFIGVW